MGDICRSWAVQVNAAGRVERGGTWTAGIAICYLHRDLAIQTVVEREILRTCRRTDQDDRCHGQDHGPNSAEQGALHPLVEVSHG